MAYGAPRRLCNQELRRPIAVTPGRPGFLKRYQNGVVTRQGIQREHATRLTGGPWRASGNARLAALTRNSLRRQRRGAGGGRNGVAPRSYYNTRTFERGSRGQRAPAGKIAPPVYEPCAAWRSSPELKHGIVRVGAVRS